jgi:hypothetical protein
MRSLRSSRSIRETPPAVASSTAATASATVVFELSLAETFFFGPAETDGNFFFSVTVDFGLAVDLDAFFFSGFFGAGSIFVPGAWAFLPDLTGVVFGGGFGDAFFVDFVTFFAVMDFAAVVFFLADPDFGDFSAVFFTVPALAALTFFFTGALFIESFDGLLAFAFLADAFFFETAIGLL